MKKLKQEWRNRIISSFLILCLLFTACDFSSFAFGEQADGAVIDNGGNNSSVPVSSVTDDTGPGNDHITSFDPNCSWGMNPGWLIKLVGIPNKYDSSYEGLITSGQLTENQASAMKKYIAYYPEREFIDDNNAINCGLIVHTKQGQSNKTIRNSSTFYCVDGRDVTSKSQTFESSHIFKDGSGAGASSWVPKDINYSTVRNNAVLWEAFKSKTLQASQIIRSGDASAGQHIANLFYNTSDVQTALSDGAWIALPANATEDQYYESRLHVLDLLVAINGMCGGQYDSMIEEYLKSLNENGNTDNFVTPMVAAVAITSFNNIKGNYVITLPQYYAALSDGHDVDYFCNKMLNAKDSYSINEIFSAYESANLNPKAIKANTAFYNQRGFWWSSNPGGGNLEATKVGESIRPTNHQGQPVGGAGYGYFTYGGKGSISTSPSFSIRASSDQSEVAQGDQVSADIKINLKQSDAIANDVLNTFITAKQNGVAQVTLTVNLSVANGEKNPCVSTSPLMDAAPSIPAGSSLQGGNKIYSTNITAEAMKPFLYGDKSIELRDTGITINKDTQNRYIADVTLQFGGYKTIQFKATGKKVESTYVASDTVDWVCGVKDPYVGHFYSTLGDPSRVQPELGFAEIKNNKPGSEDYEAMAGIPTTEDLYVGFGGDEFLCNMDVKLQKNPKTTRKYTFVVNVSNCWEVNAPCTFTCPGHGDPPVACGAAPTCVPGSGSGCSASHKTNMQHPHTHKFTFTINQPIDSFYYEDIYALNLWRLVKAEYNGNAKLTDSNTNFTIDPNLGFKSFYSQENYNPNNGRLYFEVNQNNTEINGNIWGDVTYTWNIDSGGKVKTACYTLAAKQVNSVIKGATVQCHVVSDYLALTTSEGWQTLMRHEYNSGAGEAGTFVPLTEGGQVFPESGGGDSMSLPGTKLTFDAWTEPDVVWQRMWWNNANASSNWSTRQLVRSGYNGQYSKPNNKYDNANVTQGTSLCQKYDERAGVSGRSAWPNSQNVNGSLAFEGKNMNNQRLVKKPLNIIDSTNTDTKEWSKDDGITPVYNGKWDTGHAYMYWNKDINYPTNKSDALTCNYRYEYNLKDDIIEK